MSIGSMALLAPGHVFARGAILGLAALLGGCGGLTVSMEVLNPAVVQRVTDEALITQGIPKLSVATDESIGLNVREMRAAHRRGYERIRDLYLADAARSSGKAAADLATLARIQTSEFDRTIGPYYAAFERDLRRYRDALNATLGGRYTVSPADPNYATVLAILRSWQQRTRQVSAEVRADVGKFAANAGAVPGGIVPPAQAAAVAREIATITANLEQISIQNSPYAYAVASADPLAWGGYNRVYSTGKFGATDVAIKLDKNSGNYMLKGLSFDPSDVAAVAAKVGTQALLLSAQIAGVPVKTSAAPADGTIGKALAASSSALADAQAGLETRRNLEQARKAALLALANVIVSEEADLAGSDESRAAAIKAIRNAFDARAAVLRPPAAP